MTLLFADLCAIFTPYRWMIEHVTTKRGQLRIYLGAAPGVGKTYAMLGEAHRRLERGTDVVAAVVETHGRNKTAKLLEGIEMIPPRYVEYRGARFPELDVEAVLRRHPQVVLVDELAHTNTPGSKNPKRWQDVQEILDAGITVISTVNIQHLEGLNDVVEQITGIEQKEKIPDEIVRAADQVELVDITPEALRRRLAHGNVYAAERVDAALSNYFRTGNLTALREIALLWLADQVDAALEKYRADKKITATWEARERVVVAVTGGPESETLVRRASRIASKSSAELMVVHVIRGDGLAGVSAPQQSPGDRGGNPGERRPGQEGQLAHGCRAHSVASSRRVSRSSCGITLEPPMMVMKFASPPHRGTTCTCRCSASDPPADVPRFRPTLKPCGRDTFLITRIAFWVNAINSALSKSVRSSSSDTRR